MAFEEVFVKLRGLVEKHAGFLDVETDTEEAYILTGPMMPRWKKVLWFGGVKKGKRYVSLHLMAVYMYSDLVEEIGPELRKRMHGKSCFNFRYVDEELCGEVESILEKSIERLRKEGIVVS